MYSRHYIGYGHNWHDDFPITKVIKEAQPVPMVATGHDRLYDPYGLYAHISDEELRGIDAQAKVTVQATQLGRTLGASAQFLSEHRFVLFVVEFVLLHLLLNGCKIKHLTSFCSPRKSERSE